MKYVDLGNSSLHVSRLCLGMMSYRQAPHRDSDSWRSWHLDEEAAEPIVRRAAEGGVTFFDTADMYADGASERVTGSLLRRIFPRRDEYVLATKVISRWERVRTTKARPALTYSPALTPR